MNSPGCEDHCLAPRRRRHLDDARREHGPERIPRRGESLSTLARTAGQGCSRRRFRFESADRLEDCLVGATLRSTGSRVVDGHCWWAGRTGRGVRPECPGPPALARQRTPDATLRPFSALSPRRVGNTPQIRVRAPRTALADAKPPTLHDLVLLQHSDRPGCILALRARERQYAARSLGRRVGRWFKKLAPAGGLLVSLLACPPVPATCHGAAASRSPGRASASSPRARRSRPT